LINLNIQTLVIHLVFFLIMLVVLNKLLFQPMLKVMDARKDRVDGNRQAADQAVAEARVMVDDYDAKIAEARKEAVKEKDSVRRTAEEEKEKIVKTARGKAGEMIGVLKEQIAAEYNEAQQSLRDQSEATGKDIAERILGRSV